MAVVILQAGAQGDWKIGILKTAVIVSSTVQLTAWDGSHGVLCGKI